MMKRAFAMLPVLSALCLAQTPAKEEPVGILLVAPGGKILRSGTETALGARSGDILFAGDSLKTEAAAASFLYCPTGVSQTLQPSAEVVLQVKEMKLKSGSFGASQKVSSCRLPSVLRVATASQQHYGVTMVRGLEKPAPPPPLDPKALPPAVAAELDAIGTAKDPQAAVARAAVLEKAGLDANALAEYQAAATAWPDAVWIKGKAFELQEKMADAAAKAAAASGGGGKTFALLVGISKYQKLPQELWLQYANADAVTLHKHLLSPRGGGIPADNMFLLTDEQATTASLRNVLQRFQKGMVGKKDTVLIFVAGHGTVEVPGSKSAFIVTHDSDPQDLTATGLPMAEIQDLIQTLAQNARVIALIDVCRSGTIGSIKSTTVNSVVEKLGESEGEVLGLMASRPKELSYEGPQYGGGHGAFSYFLIKALEGDADKNKDGVVNVNEVIEYVRDHVAQGTNDKQHPRDFGNIDNAVPLSDTRKPGIELAHSFQVIELGKEPLYLAAGAPPPLPQAQNASPADLKAFSDSLAAGRLLPGEPNNAFELLKGLERQLSPEEYKRQENRLRIALEDRAQQVLLKYLAGDEVPQSPQDFRSGAEFMKAARDLTPESLYLDAREAFFQGRSLLFDKKYPEAAGLLERTVRLDPNGAYAYNALGIAYLEQGDYIRAMPAFRDSIRRAPHWAYPYHNLALAQFEMGEYDEAVRSYRLAMRLRPDVSYLPYNLGLVYQKMNLPKEAESAYRTALRLAPGSPEPLNALGALKSAAKRNREAEDLFRQALVKNPRLLAARHNLALVVARDKNRQNEAIQLWNENLAQAPDHLPSLLGLADLQTRAGNTDGAIATWKRVVTEKPDYTAAHIELAGLLQKKGDQKAALDEALAALKGQPDDPAVLERAGDLYKASGDSTHAQESYRKALTTADKSSRKRLNAKLKEK